MPIDMSIPDSELALKFESLGDSCELGLVQRSVGAEPLGMFRFAGAPVRHLIRAMDARFEGMADPQHVRVQPENGEYMIKLTKYDFIYHAHVNIGDANPELLQRQQVRTVRFLTDKLIGDLTDPRKIMVFRQNEELSANDLLDFRRALSSYGPATMLWVQAARPGFAAGQVVVVDHTLMIGYVTRLSPRQNAPDFDRRSWLTMLRNAYAAWPGREAQDRPESTSRVQAPASTLAQVSPAAQPVRDGQAPQKVPQTAETRRRTDIIFGLEGNAAAVVGTGWSPPENSFTWSIDDRSTLTIAHPWGAGDYSIEMDLVPFEAPPVLVAQRMAVLVNGEPVHTFDPLARGTVTCRVPGHLLVGRDTVEIVLDHPNAARPSDVKGQNDRRRLAVAFYRLSLIGD